MAVSSFSPLNGRVYTAEDFGFLEADWFEEDSEGTETEDEDADADADLDANL